MITKELFLTYEDHDDGKLFEDVIKKFFKEPDCSKTEFLSIGSWGDSFEESPAKYLKIIIENKDKLPNLKGIYIGDMDSEECEISWIMQCDPSNVLSAFPNLEILKIQGSQNLKFSKLQHANLRNLTIVSGGLSKDVLRSIKNAKLPNLEYLELWLGVQEYGFNGSVEDVTPFMEKGLFPNLKYLGLKNSELQDEIAKRISNGSILEQIEELDLSMGTLTDEGGKYLLESDKIKQLKHLNLEYHYMSEVMMKKLKGLGIEVNVNDRQDDEEYDGETYRYPAVTE